jgi:hypothetical protein
MTKLEPLRVGFAPEKHPALTWSSLIDDPGFRDAADPLGFRAVANRAARRISPGLTQSTTSIRSFGLLLIGLDLASNAGNPDEAFQRFERMWVLATEAAANDGEDVTSYPGSQRAKQILNAGEDKVNLTRPLLTRQLSSGLWGAYRRSAERFELITRVDGTPRRGTRPASYQLTASGQDVQRVAKSAIVTGKPHLQSWIRKGHCPRRLLDEFNPSVGCKPEEAQALSAPVQRVDERDGRPLGRLRNHFARQNGLSLRKLALKDLTVDQQQAVRIARAVDLLVERIEDPFRRWISGDSSSRDAELRAAAALPEWDTLLDLGELGVEQLRLELQANAGVDTLQRYHERLCELRGAPHWERPDPSKDFGEPPDFGLSAPRRLFEDGLLA